MSKFSRSAVIFLTLFCLSACGGGGGGNGSSVKTLDSRAIVVRYGGVSRSGGRVQNFTDRDEADDVAFRTDETRPGSPYTPPRGNNTPRPAISATFTADPSEAGFFESGGALKRQPGKENIFTEARIYEGAGGDPFLSVATESENAWFGIAAKNYRASPVMTLASFYGGKEATDLPASARYGGVATGYLVATGAASPEGNGLYAARGSVEVIADFTAGSVQGKLSDLQVQDLVNPANIIPAGFEITANGSVSGSRYVANQGTVTTLKTATGTNHVLGLKSLNWEGGVFGEGGRETAGAIGFETETPAGRNLSGVLGYHAR